VSVAMETVQSNMVYAETQRPAPEWQQDLSEHGLLCFALNERTLRLVTHLHIDDEQIDQAIQIFSRVSTK